MLHMHMYVLVYVAAAVFSHQRKNVKQTASYDMLADYENTVLCILVIIIARWVLNAKLTAAKQ